MKKRGRSYYRWTPACSLTGIEEPGKTHEWEPRGNTAAANKEWKALGFSSRLYFFLHSFPPSFPSISSRWYPAGQCFWGYVVISPGPFTSQRPPWRNIQPIGSLSWRKRYSLTSIGPQTYCNSMRTRSLILAPSSFLNSGISHERNNFEGNSKLL